MGGIVFLFNWLFVLRLPTLEFVGCWVELGLGAEMRTSGRPHSNEYSLGSEVLLLVQWFRLRAPIAGAVHLGVLPVSLGVKVPHQHLAGARVVG